MKRLLSAFLLLALTSTLRAEGESSAPTPAHAASRPAETKPKPDIKSDKPSISSDSITTADGQKLSYTATTGYLPLKDESGELRANIFYIAYTLGAPPAKTADATQPATAPSTQPSRPVTFLFNGGPGAASAWLHLGAAGPKRIDIPADGSAPIPPYKMVDNPHTWLPATDLVFVDPVNTGYSRAATPDKAKEFLGVNEDINAMAEFIRLYLTTNQRWDSKIFLAGESYGTTRAAGLAHRLEGRNGISVTGVILISTVLNFAVLSPGEANDLPYALYLPSYAATAWYHKRLDTGVATNLDAVLKAAQEYATNEYPVILAKGAALTDQERTAAARKLASITGLSEAYILESNLRIEPERFEKQLLRSPTGLGGKIVGRFDARITGLPTDPAGDSQEYDPSLSGFFSAYTASFNDYVRKQLHFESDLPYEVLSNRVYPWNWSRGGPPGDMNGYLYVGNNLRDAMTHHPHMRLLVCSGIFDLATPYFATTYQLNHLGLSPEIRKNITETFYPAGHMLYHTAEGLKALSENARTFITK